MLPALPLALSFALPLAPAGGFTPGFAEGAHVQGARPAPELRRALQLAAPALDACVNASESESESAKGRAELLVDADVLAAGFIDRAVVVAAGGNDAVIDEACVLRVLRALELSDRGIEPRTHLLVHVVAGGPLPRPTPRELAEALLVAKSDVDRCEAAARRRTPAMAGSIVLRFDVAGERARPVVAGGSISDGELKECIMRALDGVRVAGAHERAQIMWPLYFARAAPPRPTTTKPRSPWEAETLFDFLGCGSAFAR